MIGLDIIGTENVLKYIETSKLSKFTIDANKSGHYICVFECINSNNNETALQEFAKWADFINPNQSYKITLFDSVEVIQDDNGLLKTKKTKLKSNKMAATFILNESYSNNNRSNSPQIANSYNEEDLFKKITSKITEDQTNNAILTEIRALSERLNKIELEEAAEEEEEESNLGGINSNQVEQIMGLINMFKNQTQKPALNGDIDLDQDPQILFKQNINKAIKILYKNDPLLDQDLLKLAQLSETKKETFKMLLQTLRNM